MSGHTRIMLCIFCLALLSCKPARFYVRPGIECRIYDLQSRQPVRGADVHFSNNRMNDYTDPLVHTDDSGRAHLPPIVIRTGDYRRQKAVQSLSSRVMTFGKEGYRTDSIDIDTYFLKRGNYKNYRETFVTDSLFISRLE